jgi:hypothetical protein
MWHSPKVETSALPAFHFNTSYMPVLVVEVNRGSTDAEHAAYLADLHRFYIENDLIAVVFHVKTRDLPSGAQQRAQGAWMKAHKTLLAEKGVGVAFVFPSAAFRFVLSAILLIQRLPHEYTIVGTLEEGLAWARGRLEARLARRR